MFKRIYRGRFTCSKYVTNLFIVLLIVRGATSFIESDVSDHIGNTTASLRLTRQKVLIQAVQKPEKLAERRLARDKHAIDDQDDYVPPDIVVEEFRIRAKINIQTRPRTCKDVLRDFSNNSKSRAGLSSSQDPRIVYCQAESLIPNNETLVEVKNSISTPHNAEIHENNFLSKTTTGLLNKIIFSGIEKNGVNSNGTSNEKLKNLFLREKNRRAKKSNGWILNLSKNKNAGTKKKEVGPKAYVFKKSKELTLDTLDENSRNKKPSFREIETKDDKEEMGLKKSSPLFETQNNELEKSEPPFVASDFEKKIQKRSTKYVQVPQPCHSKSKINVTSYSAALGLEKTEASMIPMAANRSGNHEELFEENQQLSISHNFRKKPNKISNKTDIFGSHQRNRRSLHVPNNTTTAPIKSKQKKMPKKADGKKKTKYENSKEKSEPRKSGSRKTRNSTDSKEKSAKLSNNTMWNLAMPPVFTRYSTLFSTLFGPLIDAVSKDLAHVSKEKLRKNASTINPLSVSGGDIVSSSTEIHIPNSPEIHFSNPTNRRFLNSTEIPSQNSTEIPSQNSPEIPSKNSTEIYFPTTTEIRFTNSPEISSANLVEHRLSNSTEMNFPNSTSIVTTSSILPSIKKARNNPDINLHEHLTDPKVKNANEINSLLSTSGFEPKDLGNNSAQVYETADSKTGKNDETWNSHLKDNEGKLSEIEMSVIKMTSPTENYTNISSDTSDKPEDYNEKATLNFTIIDTNCTDPLLLNSLPNNSANQSANIAEVLSTYQTHRRYSRNDTVDEIAGPKIENIVAKDRKTKNSLTDSNPSIPVRKSHVGLGNRGRKRSRYKGKMQHPLVANMLPRVGKQSWRIRNNVSAISISSLPTIPSTLPTGISDLFDSSGSGRSILSTIIRNSSELSLPTVSAAFEWQKLNSTNTSILKPDSLDYLVQNPQNEESNILATTQISINEIPRPIGSPAKSYEFFEKKEVEASTSSEPSPASNLIHFSPSKEIEAKSSFKADESNAHEEILINEILTKKSSEFSTVSYDKNILVDPLVTTKVDDSIKKDQGIEATKKNEKIKKIDENKSSTIFGTSTTVQSIVPVESTREHGRVVNTAIVESSTLSYTELSVPSAMNELQLSIKNKSLNESMKKEDEIPEGVNTLSTVDKTIKRDFGKSFGPSLTKKQKLIFSTPSMTSFKEELPTTLNHSTNMPDKTIRMVDSTYPESTTEFQVRMRNNEERKMEEFSGNPESSTATPKNIIMKNSSLNWESKTDGVTLNVDIKGETLSSKNKTVIVVPTAAASAMIKIAKKTAAPAGMLSRSARRTRDIKALSEYEESQEPELDYDIDSLAAGEKVPENTPKIEENIAEGLRGATNPRNSRLTELGVPHSAVHGVFFKDNKASDDLESAVNSEIHHMHDYQTLAVPTATSLNTINFPNEFPDNFTNIFDETELLALVKSLEEFLFDDSATGTSDRKRMILRDQDLVAESSNRNPETRSALFKTKKLSANKKLGANAKKSDSTKNWGKSKSLKSTKKRTSDNSSIGKRNRPKTVKTKKTKIEKKKKQMKKEKKARKAKVSKTPSTLINRQTGGKGKNSTDRISSNE